MTVFVATGCGSSSHPSPTPSGGTSSPTTPAGGTTVSNGFGPTSTATLKTNFPIPGGAVFVATTGNDAAAGTKTAPLRTLAAAVTKAPSGGTIVLRGGTYRETVASVTKRLTIQPYPQESVWLSGSDVITGWTKSGNGWRSTTWRSSLCQTCYKPDAVNASHPQAGKPNQVFVNGVGLNQVGNDAQLNSNTFYLDSSGAMVIGRDPAGAQVEASTRWKAIQLNGAASGSTIRGIGFKQYAPVWNETQLGAVIINTTNVNFTGNIVTQSAGTGLAILAAGAEVTGNTISRNGYRGVVANKADDLVLTNDRFDVNNTAGFNITSCGWYCTVAGVKVTHTRNITVTASSFQQNGGSGFWCDLGCINTTITGNIVSDNASSGLFYEVSEKATISDNYIAHNNRGLKISGSATVAVTHNQFVENPIALGVYDDPRSPSTDNYSAANGLTWNTAGVSVTGNLFLNASGKTTRILDTNSTSQVSAPAMFRTFSGNTFTPATTGKVYWCPSSSCVTYPNMATFQNAVNLH
ncbi:MAG: right-handed parallel beta-helix repeat-containing protein [Frankia sp.]